MKKILLVMVLLVLVPLNVFATTFELDDIDMNITFDESVWYVFTPDNILNNPELDELGISYDYMNAAFQNNHAYVNAILFYQDTDDYIEIFVRRSEVDFDDLTLSNISFARELGSALAEEQNASYEIYQGDYIFIQLDYIDQGLYLNEYYTIQNGYAYTLTAQKPYSFDSYDEGVVQDIVDSIFIEGAEALDVENEDNNYFVFIIVGVLALILAGAVVLGIVLVVKSRKKSEV